MSSSHPRQCSLVVVAGYLYIYIDITRHFSGGRVLRQPMANNIRMATTPHSPDNTVMMTALPTPWRSNQIPQEHEEDFPSL
jgi:hypothetical protein